MRTVQKGNYRQEGNHLYKKQNDGSFLHVYQDAFCQTIDSLIKSYENHCEEDFINGDSRAYD